MFRVLFLCSTVTLRLGSKFNSKGDSQGAPGSIQHWERRPTNYGPEILDGKFYHKLRGIPGRIFSKMRDM